MKTSWRGFFYAFMAGLLWGATSPIAQFLFEDKGVTPEGLVPFRLLCSGILLLLYAKMSRQDITAIWKERRDIPRLFAFSVFGMMGMQYFFFAAVNATNAATATIFQYLNPAILIIYFSVIYKMLPRKQEVAAVLCAVTGITIVATHGNLTTLAVSPKGIILGLILALATCFYGVLPGPLIKKYSPIVVAAWGMIVGGAVLTVLTRPWTIMVPMDIEVLGAFGAIVILGTIIPFCCYMSALKHIGSVYAGLLSSVEPVAATVVAVLFLGTTFIAVDVIGFALVLSTAFILAIPDKR